MNPPVSHMERAGVVQTRGYFEHDADIGIIGGGTSVEQAFEAALNALQAGKLSADAAWKQFLDNVPAKGAY